MQPKSPCCCTHLISALVNFKWSKLLVINCLKPCVFVQRQKGPSSRAHSAINDEAGGSIPRDRHLLLDVFSRPNTTHTYRVRSFYHRNFSKHLAQCHWPTSWRHKWVCTFLLRETVVIINPLGLNLKQRAFVMPFKDLAWFLFCCF